MEIGEMVAYGNYGITLEQVCSGKLETLVGKGLQVLTICNDGSGRSCMVAKSLNAVGIPAVCLLKGLNRIKDEPEKFPLGYLVSKFNEVPNVAVILTPQEMRFYNGILNQIRVYRYPASETAISSLVKMIKEDESLVGKALSVYHSVK